MGSAPSPTAQDAQALALKHNALRLAYQHRQTCPGATCTVSLALLLVLLERAGIDVNEEERKRFL